MANIVVAYVMWLLGGLFGLHHFYLKRDRHAFFCWCTLGGLGLGWLRDVWRLPEYLLDANSDPRYINEFKDRVKKRSRPPFSYFRFTAELLMGVILAVLSRLAIPGEFEDSASGKLWVALVPSLGASIGVHIVANIGRERSSMRWPLSGAYLLSSIEFSNTTRIFFITLVSAIFTNFKGSQWRLKKNKKGFCRRVLVLSLAGSVYICLWSATIYFNVTITTDHGEQVLVREAVHNFFRSPAWKEMKDVFHKLHQYYNVHGWRKIFDELMTHLDLDPGEEQNALNVLGLSDNASLEEIRHTYRQLSRLYHPDKHKSADDKKLALQRYLEIQEAYEKLSRIKSKRKNKYSKTEDDNF